MECNLKLGVAAVCHTLARLGVLFYRANFDFRENFIEECNSQNIYLQGVGFGCYFPYPVVLIYLKSRCFDL